DRHYTNVIKKQINDFLNVLNTYVKKKHVLFYVTMNFDLLQDKLKHLRKRDALLRIVRNFFYSKDFLEIDAPILVEAAGMEPHLDPFIAIGSQSGSKYFLPTSPEFYLKKVLSAGEEKIFSLCPSFRDETESISHSHQFLMLEWYRAKSTLEQIIIDCEELLKEIESNFDFPEIINDDGKRIFLGKGIYIAELDHIFQEITGLFMSQLKTEQEWQALAKSFGAQENSHWTINDCFSYISVSQIEKKLKKFDKPVILRGYPQFQCALAELRADGLSDRFELYIAGVEIANAYNELRGKEENLKRYIYFQNERKKMGKTPHPEDRLFFDAVDNIPQSAGIAFGIDRFLSLLLKCPIKDCQNR
ncbi:MAG: hypothetical protein N2445_06070, partial [Acidobacteria bacterium]|nr:hypothetical protein [Acidobacteriota bacterium]